MEPTLCFIDTETTGLHPDLHEVWEVAAIRRAPGGNEERLWMHLPLDSMENADPFALDIGKFWDRYRTYGEWDEVGQGWPENGEFVASPFAAARMLREFTHGAHLIGNVVSFDAERLGKFLRKWEQVPTWHYHILDIEPMIYGMALGSGVFLTLPYKSRDLTEALGVPEPDAGTRHTALGDAEWVRSQWNRLHELGKEAQKKSWGRG